MTRLMTAACVALALAAPAAQQAAGRDLVGVWKLVSYTRDGKPLAMEAMLVITPKHFTRVLMEKDRPDFEGFDFRRVEKLTPDQLRVIAEAYPRFNASSGTWRVAGNVFYFTSTAHHNPGAVGRESDRTFELKGDRLRMYAQAGSGQVDEIWERVENF